MLSRYFAIVTLFAGIGLLSGCSSSRDVEVTGQVSSASAKGEIILEFFDVNGDQKTSVHTAKADATGAFKETVSLEGDEVLVRAVEDADANGACSEGESWAEASGAITDDKVDPIQLTLASAPCPK